MESVKEAARGAGRIWVGLGGLFGLLGVGSGAFAAHGLQAVLEPRALEWLRLASDYWLFHAAALVGVGLLLAHWPTRLFRLAAAGLFLGGMLFSGSLALMALSGVKALAWITPLGGVLLLLGWACLAVGALAARSRPGAG